MTFVYNPEGMYLLAMLFRGHASQCSHLKRKVLSQEPSSSSANCPSPISAVEAVDESTRLLWAKEASTTSAWVTTIDAIVAERVTAEFTTCAARWIENTGS
jgi:hypothetical protein